MFCINRCGLFDAYIATCILILKPKQIEKSFVIFGVVNALFGILQEIVYLISNKILIGSQGGQDVWYLFGVRLLRVEGLVGDSNVFALYLIIPLILIFYDYLLKPNLRTLTLVIVMFTSLVLTFSRGGLLGAIIGIILVCLYRRSIRAMIWFVILTACSAAVFIVRIGSRSDTTRMFLLSYAINIWKDNPFWGVGPGKFGSLWGNTTAHNLILESLSETGIFATLLIIFMLAIGFIMLHKKKKLAMSMALKGFYISSLFLSVLTNTLFWTAMGIMFVSAPLPKLLLKDDKIKL